MRSTRSILPGLLALSLAVALPAAAAAQDGAAEASEVAYTTGSATGEPAQFVPPSVEDTVDDITTMRGVQMIGTPVELTDPRLSGLLSFTANGSGQEFADGWGQIESRTYRIENADGAWTGSGTQVFAIGSDEPLVDQESMVLSGEGAYDGLAAYVSIEVVDGERIIEAVVLDHEVPPAPDPVAATAVAGVPTLDEIADLDSYLSSTVADASGGVVALVTRDGETTTSAAGIANAAGDPMTIDRAFPVGSISKTFVSTMVLQLVDEGLVDLEAPLSTYLPETTIGADVTVRQLLSHHSGIADVTAQPGFFDEVYQDLDRTWTVDEILATVVDAPIEEPGGEFSYSNTNYILLGQLLEAVEGTDLESSLRARIVEPLGLQATTFDDDSLPADILVGVWGDGDSQGALMGEAISSSVRSAGGLLSTPADLAEFMTALLAGQLMSDELLTEMLATGPEGYGLGMSTMPPGSDAGAFYGHDGFISTFGAFLAGNPETGEIVVVLNNDARLFVAETAGRILDTLADGDA